MITLRRAEERHHDQRRKQQVWQTFAPRDRAGLPAGGFGILDGALEVKRFAAALRHNELCTVASTDGRKGSLRILQNALIMSGGLDPGHHIVHELIPGRSAWVHVTCGEATLETSS